MPTVLTTGSIVTCAHFGLVSTTGNDKLKVANNPVLLEAGIAGKSIDPVTCATVPDPNTSTVKCTSVTTISDGRAQKLTIGGQPVMLDTLAGKTSGTVPPEGFQSLAPPQAVHTKLTSV